MDTAVSFELSSIGVSLYIHIPWCIKKCPYCDFNSHTLPQNTPFDEYVTALLDDAKAQSPLLQGRKIRSIFIGGGTPSLLPIAHYQRLFDGLYRILPIGDTCEITLEANPATLEHAPFKEYLALGINRLSLGVQSFDDKLLTTLGRIHTKNHAIHAIGEAKMAGFERINTDLMHGLPNQSVDLAMADIAQAITLGATHISWYQLTIEPNTVFFRTRPQLPDEAILEQIEQDGQDYLYSQGFDNYEVSAWVSRQDNPCLHNLNYWQFGDYLAIGAGSHGKISLLDDKLVSIFGDIQTTNTDIDASINTGIYRFSKSRMPKDYLSYGGHFKDNHPKFVGVRQITHDELPSEYMMNALRLRHGTILADFSRYTGLPLSTIMPTLKTLTQQGLLEPSDTLIKPTALGYRYVNHLVQAFL